MVRMPPFIGSRRLGLWPRLVWSSALGSATAVVLGSLGAAPAIAQKEQTPAEVKAADLFNFGKFMRHGNGYLRHATFDICILGRDPLGQAIDNIAAHESIDNLPVRVPRISDVTGAKTCEIVYITDVEGERLREDMAILLGTDVLTVSDVPNFLERGGMIQFVQVANRVRFSVNLTALNRSHLVLSSELLKVAASVTGKTSSEVLP